MLPLRIPLLLVLAFASAVAQQPDPADDPERLRLLEAAVKARRLIRAHESGEKAATPVEIEAARAAVNDYNKRFPTVLATISEQERQERVAVEVAIRRVVREVLTDKSTLPSDPEVAEAIQLIRAHEAGEKEAAPPNLQAAQAVLRRYAVARTPTPMVINDPKAEAERLKRVGNEVARRRKLREQAAKTPATTGTSPQDDGDQRQTATTASTPRPAQLHFPQTDMSTVATLYKKFHPGATVTIADGVKARQVRLVFDASSEDEAKTKLHAELRRQGIAIVPGPDGSLVLDAVP